MERPPPHQKEPADLDAARDEIQRLRQRLEARESELRERVGELSEANRQVTELFEATRAELTQRCLVEEELRARTSRYELIAEGAGAAIWDWDVPGRRVHYSPRWKALRGFAEDEISEDEAEWSSRIHPEDVARVLAAVQDHFDGKTPYFEEEYRVLCKDGSYKWIADRGLARRDRDGRVVRMAGSEMDVTERRRSEEARRRLAQRLCSVRDEERARISRRIHDELGQTLTALKMELSLRERESIDALVQLLDAGIETVRRIASDLHPSVLDDLGLCAAVDWQAGEFQRRTSIECTTHLDEVDLDRDRATTVYRVLQEALLNVYRHAGAQRVRITLTDTAAEVRLAVRDDGRGMDVQSRATSSGIGLLSMRERATIFGGRIDIVSAPGAGTTVRLTLPHAPTHESPERETDPVSVIT